MEEGEGVPRPTRGSEVKLILDAERRGDPFLLFRNGDGALEVLSVGESPFIVGRLSNSGFTIDWDDQVSRVHAELVSRGSSWLIADENLSRNGTFVGNTKVSGRKLLENGDVIRFGNTLAVFRNPGGAKAGGTTVAASGVVVPDLTSAQLRVLRALCRPAMADQSPGLGPATNREIADELFLSLDAVKGHLKVLFHKFGVADLPQNRKRSALVDQAIRTGIAQK